MLEEEGEGFQEENLPAKLSNFYDTITIPTPHSTLNSFSHSTESTAIE